MPPTSGAHCLAVGCSHADPALSDGDLAPAPRSLRRVPSRRAGRRDELRAARRANLLAATLGRRSA